MSPLLRRAPVPGSVVDLLYDDSDNAPTWEERRLERHLSRMFPLGCDLSLVVEAAWSEAEGAWLLRRAILTAGIDGDPDIAESLKDSLRRAGLPIL